MESNQLNNNFIIHLHMPKTGGTTLKKVIHKIYKNKVVDLYVNANQLEEEINKLLLGEISCLQGHFPCGVHKYIEQSFTYVTMLRHPVERIISEYYFIRSIPWHELHDKVKEMSLYDYQADSQTQNLQTRYILGNLDLRDLSNENVNQAMEHLTNHFSIVGITELFDESFYLMKKAFGWKQNTYKFKNKTKNKPALESISAELLKEIAKNNNADLELYTFARERLEDTIQKLSVSNKKELRILKKQNQAY